MTPHRAIVVGNPPERGLPSWHAACRCGYAGDRHWLFSWAAQDADLHTAFIGAEPGRGARRAADRGPLMYAKDTTVPVAKTRGEIETLLERCKAKQYGTAVDYDQLQARVQFRLHDRIVRFVVTLPDRRRLTAPGYERAERQRWRALLLVLKAKIESVESGIETFEHAFLSQIVMGDQTAGEILTPVIAFAYKTGHMPKLLEAGAVAAIEAP